MPNKYPIKVAFLSPYPFDTAPGQRFRYELFLKNISKDIIEAKHFSYLDIETHRILYKKGNTFQKIWGVFTGFLRRILFLFQCHSYDFIFIYREATPIGPPIFEFLLSKIFRKKIVYDFDDAIWLPVTTSENWIAGLLKWQSKVKSICKWSYCVSCGNDFLSDFARKVNKNVVTLPTVVDTINRHNKVKIHENKEKVVIGWTGTHSTLHYLDMMIPILQKLLIDYSFEFVVIADKNPKLPLNNFRFIQWSADTEIEDLLQFDIGIMPLKNTHWELGKCGFKAIQYMALGIPTIASPVGVNNNIIENGQNGYLCCSKVEWEDAFRILIANTEVRKNLGLSSRKTIVDKYSEIGNRQKFIDLFK